MVNCEVRIMNNSKLYYTASALYTIGITFCTGTILQAYMLNIGVSESNIYLYTSLLQAIQFISIFLSLFYIDKLRKVKKIIAFCELSPLLIVFLLIYSIFANSGAEIFQIFLILSILSFFFTGIYGTICYRFPYEIIPMAEFGKLTATSAIISGGLSFLMSTVYSVLNSNFDFKIINGIFFILAGVCLLGAFYFTNCCREISIQENTILTKHKFDFSVLKNRTTHILIVPNFLRGVAVGIINLLPVIGVSMKIVDSKQVTILAGIACLSSLFGNYLFINMQEKTTLPKILIGASVAVFITLPLSIVFNNSILFIVLYFLIITMVRTIDTVIPVSVCRVIPYNQIGSFSSIRMMLFTLGQSVSPLLMNKVLPLIGYFWLLIIAGLMLLICCGGYSISLKRSQKNEQ